MTKPRSRRGFFRLPLLILGFVLVLAAAGLIVAQSQLSPDRLRATLQRAAHRATGRDLAINGGVHMQLGLSPTLVVEGISLSNPPGASRPVMLTARSLSANLALLPLLAGDAVIERLTIDQPDILLERLPDGVPNWQFSGPRRALYQGTGSGGGSSASGGRAEIHHITMQGGQLAWRQASGNTLAVGISTLGLASEGEGAPVTLDLTGTRGGVPFTAKAVSGPLERLQGGLTSKLEGAWPLTMDLTAAGAALRAEGGVNHPEELRGFQFKLHGDIPDLAAFGAMVPEISLPALKAVAFSATIADGTQGELRTSQVSAQAGASDLSALAAGLAIAHLDFKAPGPGQIAQLGIDGTYDGAPARVSMTAVQPDTLTATAPVQVTMSARAADAMASVHGTVPPSREAAGLDLLVSLHAPDLAKLSPLAGRKLPEAHDVDVSAHATDAGFRLHGVTLGDLSVKSSLGDLAGTMTLGWSPRPSFRGTLTSGTLDLDGLWQEQTQAAPPVEMASPLALQDAPPGYALSRAQIPLSALRSADIDVSLTAGSLILGGQHYRDLDTHVQLADGKLAVNPFRVSAPEGPVVGGATVDASTDLPPVAVTLRSAAFSAASVARLLGTPGGASGTMQLDAQLSGTGADGTALASTLDGHLGVAMVNGDLDNALVQSLVGSALDTAGAPSLGDGRSQVRCLALRLNFKAGAARVGVLALDTSRLALDGTGSIDFAGRTLDLHLRPHVRLGGTEAVAPVSVSGPFAAPVTRLDPVLGGGRVGISIGSVFAADQGSACAAKLAAARGGLAGPLPTVTSQGALPSQGLSLKKLPTDLLRGLFH